jgi:predicted RNA binding protein YcfA (HicA-like mRNA interferase family)
MPIFFDKSAPYGLVPHLVGHSILTARWAAEKMAYSIPYRWLHSVVSRLTPVSHRQLVQRLRSFGWDGPFAGGKHLKMEREDLTITIPNRHKDEIGTSLSREVLRQARIAIDNWNGRWCRD